MGLLLSWLILSVGVAVAAAVVPGFRVRGTMNVVVVAAIFGLLNALIGWLIFLVLGIGTLGLGFLLAFVTRWIVNALLLKLTDAMTDRLSIRDFTTALFAAAVISIVGAVGEWVLR